MANTINNTTDEALLRSIIDGSITEFEDDSITTLNRDRIFYGCNLLTRLSLPNLTYLNGYIFSIDLSGNCTALETIDLPKLVSSNTSSFIRGLPSLININLPEYSGSFSPVNCNGISKIFLPKCSEASFQGFNKLKYLVFPNIVTFGKIRDAGGSEANLIGIDFGTSLSTINPGGDDVFYQTRCNNINALVIRSNTLVPITKTLGGYNSSLAFGQSSNNKIYVPQALISEYQNATNWSTYSSLFNAIEGSIYEHYYADGTPIGLSAYGLIGYYAIGESGRYEAIENVPSHINSSVDSDLVAWTHTNGNAQMAVVSSGGTIPSNFYNGYTNAGKYTLGIYSDTAFLSDTDAITLEYSIAVNTDNVSIRTNVSGCVKNGINNAATSNKVELELYGFNKNASSLQTTGANRMFMHKIVELHSDNTYNVYINGQLEGSNQTYNNISTMNFINVGLNADGFLGPVAIYNRALSSDEIAEHYQFYVDNYMVGQTAYDSSGNFVGA